MSLKKSLMEQGMKLLSDPRVIKLMQNEQFMKAMMTAISMPGKIDGFTKEQAEKLTAADPYNSFLLTPAGSVREAPGAPAFYEMSAPVMVMSSSRMTQETGYRIMKAVLKGWKEIGEAYPPAQGIKPIEDAFEQTPNVKEVLFHAGVVQMAQEMGIQVPQRLIPPEYKPK